MLQIHVRQLFAVVVAVGVFTAFAVAPVAASGGIDLGGDDGIGIGTDGVGLGGDDGVQVGLDPDDGVNASVGGDEGLSVEASPDDGVEAGAGGERVGVGPDGVDAGDAGVGDGGLGAVGSQVESIAGDDAGVDSLDGGLGDATGGLDGVAGDGLGDATDGLGDADVPTEPRDVHLDTDEVPDQARLLQQVLRNVPETDAVGPEDSPVGGEDAPVDVCGPLDVESGDLPVGGLPGLGDLPESAQPPGLPADLVTPEAVTGIALGFVPGACEVVDPTDPQVDPTDLPDEPGGELDVARFGQYQGGGVGVVTFDGTLNESGDGPGVSGVNGILVTPQFADVDQELVVNDGRHDYGVDPRLRWNDDGYQYRAVLILLGKHAGVEGHCEQLEEYDGDASLEGLEEDPLGPCEYRLVGLPNLYGPGDVVGTINDQADSDEPPVDLDALPVNPDALLNL